jgi:hypothetical protein
MDKEIEVMGKVSKALSEIKDEDAIQRVLNWIMDKYGAEPRQPNSSSTTQRPQSLGVPSPSNPQTNGINDIGVITPSGDLKITIRDLKAKSAVDAATRLALVTIYTHQKLTGEEYTSSRKIVTPTLKNYRLYTGNSRRVLGNHKGIVRDGDNLTLDMHAESEAEAYLTEIRDSSISGSWSPTNKTSSSKKKPSKTKGDK